MTGRCFGSSEKGDKIHRGAHMEIKCREVIEGKVIQRLSHMGIHPIYNHPSVTVDVKKCFPKGD